MSDERGGHNWVVKEHPNKRIARISQCSTCETFESVSLVNHREPPCYAYKSGKISLSIGVAPPCTQREYMREIVKDYQDRILKYRNIMDDIKRRLLAVNALLSGHASEGYMGAAIESAYLQYRNILELIAISSLAVDSQLDKKTRKKLEGTWKAGLILNEIEKVHPHFYPCPIGEADDYLTRGHWETLHKKCSNMIHSVPYSLDTNYEEYHGEMEIWGVRILCLIANHSVHLVDDTECDVHLMGEKEQVRMYLRRFPN